MASASPESASLIMLQFLAWVADRPRDYRQTMEAWRSTCPRLSVWEDAIIDGLVRLDNGTDRAVELTRLGPSKLKKAQAPRRRAFLPKRGRGQVFPISRSRCSAFPARRPSPTRYCPAISTSAPSARP